MSRLDELINEFCPDGVEYKAICEFCKVGTGKSNRQDADENGEYPFYVRSKEVFLNNSYEFDEEAIIIPGEGSIGEIFHYVNGKYALHQRAYRIHIEDNYVITKFLYYYMSQNFKKFIYQKAVNATVKSIRKPMIEKFVVPIPPLPVQREIVRILDNFTELTAELTARKKQYEYYRRNLLKCSECVSLVELGDIAEFKYGFTDAAKIEGNAKFIRITDILENGKLNKNENRYIDLTEESKKYLLSKGDLLVARTGATYGKTMLFNDSFPSVYASFLIRIRFKKNTEYYWHFAQSSLYWQQANKLVSKAGQPQFNANVLRLVKISMPSIDFQRRIVDILDRFDALCNDITIGLPAEIEARQKQYEYYRDKLLTFKEKLA